VQLAALVTGTVPGTHRQLPLIHVVGDEHGVAQGEEPTVQLTPDQPAAQEQIAGKFVAGLVHCMLGKGQS